MKYLIVGADQNIEKRWFPLVYEDENWRIYENKRALPRAYAVFSYEILSGREAILGRLVDSSFNPAQAVILEQAPSCALSTAEATGEVEIRWLEDEPNRLALATRSASDTLLVVADSYYPGWIARVDGRPTEILVANFIQRAIVVPAGDHRVEFEMCPGTLLLGSIISFASWLLCLGTLLGLTLRERRRRSS